MKLIYVIKFKRQVKLIHFTEKSVFTQEGTLRGCAKISRSFSGKHNCTKTKTVTINMSYNGYDILFRM